MDAKTLFEEGVVAIRDQKDASKGRELLMQSLKIEPKNELAWLWLSRTMNEPQKKIQCLERALKLNPNNQQTRALISKLNTQAPTPPAPSPAKPASLTRATVERLSTNELKAISSYSMTPNVTADMEDMGLTPDLGAVLASAASIGAPAVKRTTGENAAITHKSSGASGLKDLRAEYDDEDALDTEVLDPASLPVDRPPISAAQSEQIKKHLAQAQSLLNKNKIEEAIEQWVRVLEIEVDNEDAMANAVRYLSRLKYIDDARELVWNALKAGTTHPSIYLTAIDIAKYQGADGEADELRLKLVQLPEAGEKTVMSVVEHFVEHEPSKALIALDRAIPVYPKNQKMAFRRAQLAEEMGLRKEAATYYEQAAQLGSRSKEGQLADKKLTEFMPHMSDKERGSVFLAIREAFGVGFLYLLMAFQDAGLNFALLGAGRIGGIAMSILGGYLLVTATSSPQQKPLASWLGGSVPVPKAKVESDKEDEVKKVMGDPDEIPTGLPIIPVGIRVLLGIVGVVLLVSAFVLVFSTALGLVRNLNLDNFYVPTIQDFINEN